MNTTKMLEIMKEKGMSLNDLAAASGVPVGTVNKIVHGITKEPSVEKVWKIVHVLGHSLDEFVDDYEPTTIAAHHDADEWTDDELQEIEQFKKYVKSKRKK